MPDRVVVLVVSDLLARSRLEEALRDEGVSVVTARRLPDALEDAPALVVIDLDAPGALDQVESWRALHADVPVAGFISHVDTAGWKRAESLGVHVMTRGKAAAGVSELLRR